MSAQHTPGPWHVSADESCDLARGLYVRHLDGPIAFASSGNVADARLIAAAPELLDACKATLDYWTTTGFAQCEPDCACIVDMMRAAIAKAEGQS